MKIGIIGTGNMGRTVGVVLAEAGHQVFFGARDLARARAAAAKCRPLAQHGSNDEAAAFGEVIFWTPRDAAPADVLATPTVLAGKIVLDPNNGPVPGDGSLGPASGDPSLAERLAATLPGARVVKAFNTMAQEVFELAPDGLRAHGVSAFLAGDDEEAKHVAANLARDIGFVAIDAGPLSAARSLEGLADFIRTMMGRGALFDTDDSIPRGLGLLATVSVQVLPAPDVPRLGGREPSRLK